MSIPTPAPPSAALSARLLQQAEAAGGWLRFDAFMRAALYEPGLGYYTGTSRQFGRLARDGSDFVTAPEMSPLFGRVLAGQAREVMAASAPHVLECGAGSGRLAADMLLALGDACASYSILDLSATLQALQRETIARVAPQHLHKVQWLDRLPAAFSGLVVGNELLDAMPVRLIERAGAGWLELGVVPRSRDEPAGWQWAPRPADAALLALVAERIPHADALPEGYRTEVAEEAPAFVATMADWLERGVALLLDYGFPAAEYYHPQRSRGTLICHQGHRSDDDPLSDVGAKDITAHVDFTAVALAGQDAGLDVLGYTSQGRFLLNAGLAAQLESADFKARAAAQPLYAEHEMGELFKVIAFSRGLDPAVFELSGLASGDRTHTL